MNIHIIKVSLDSSGVLQCQPEKCEVFEDAMPTAILWHLDEESLGDCEFIDILAIPSGLDFIDMPPPGRFEFKSIDRHRKHILILNRHHANEGINESQRYWGYKLRVKNKSNDIYETEDPTKGDHPIIINR